ncbi:uncharacterized protein [Penaeus vannamei]|uniref:uncharacterized protein n=1 Tax=Penaeus vannamei TaxID=6689 RepID=UPI00387F8633
MVREVPRASVCVPRLRSSILMLEGAVDASRAEHLCASHGGGLPRARDPLLNRTVWEDIQNPLRVQRPTDTTSSSLQGIRRIPGYSRSFWLKPVDSPCFMVYATPYGLIPTDLQPCKDLALHLACEVPVSARYFLRRAGPPSTDDTFYLRPRDLTPLFLSPGGRRITLGEDGALTLTDAAGGREAWVGVAEGALGVLGRRNWTVGGNRSEEMALSVCARDQFTCSDGACVGLARRCDGVDDCGDESDEVCGLLLPLPLSYRRHRPPLRRTPVALTAVLGRILELDDAMNTLTVVLELSSRWRDPRVTLQQLSNNPLENELQLGELWVPEYNLDNAVFKDKISYSKGEGVKRRLVAHKNGSGEANVFGGYEAFFYSNSSSFLEYNETFAFSFDCEFDLELYPFDSHVCWIDLSVSRKGSFHAFFDPGVLLSRKYSAYVINTLGPCVLVAIIGYITLFFEQDNFRYNSSHCFSQIPVHEESREKAVDFRTFTKAHKVQENVSPLSIF